MLILRIVGNGHGSDRGVVSVLLPERIFGSDQGLHRLRKTRARYNLFRGGKKDIIFFR
jgi:hypothetical protein